MPVWHAFESALTRLVPRTGAIDALVLTGDIANAASLAAYRRLRARLQALPHPVYVIPGNHDSRRRLHAVFGDRLVAGRERANFVAHARGLRLIGLDSSWPWRNAGRLGREQLRWLATLLAENVPSLLFVHHPPLRVGTWWLDRDRLRDAQGLTDVLRGSSVRGVFFGHVHQEHEGEVAGIPAFGTPSAAYQFRPGSWRPGATSRGTIGLRVIESDDAGVRTRVERIALADRGSPR